MESEKEEALHAKKVAETLFKRGSMLEAKQHAVKAQTLCPGLTGVSQMVATFNIYSAYEKRVKGEVDYYSVLGVKPTANDNKVTKQYNRMAVLLNKHGKKKCVGAEGALKLVTEAWAVLSDPAKRRAYDMRINNEFPNQNNLTGSSSVNGNAATATHFDHAAPLPHHRLDTFWTVCTGCKVQYEYLRKYLNKKLSCKNCRGVFMAVETGISPVNGSYPFHTWSPMPANGGSYASTGVNGVAYYPSNSVMYTGNGVHLGHGSDYSSNLSFQWSSSSNPSAGVVIPNGLPSISAERVYKSNGKVKAKSIEKRKLADQDNIYLNMGSISNPSTVYRNPFLTKTGRIDKRRRLDTAAILKSLFEDTESDSPHDTNLPNTISVTGVDQSARGSTPSEPHVKRFLLAPQIDIRNMLINKAKSDIRKKLGEIAFSAEAAVAAEKNSVQHSDNAKSVEVDRKSEPISIHVPDPDFHDFDKDRSEECFKAKQIWALYDEEDGMPRLYCMIRQVLSLDPFKMHITYLSSRTCSEFGSMNWIAAGFTKSCGNFKTVHSDMVDQVNIFSHMLSDDIKAGRGGCVRIFPKKGDIWAVYRNWSPDWDGLTPDEVRQVYEMVEIVDDYTEEGGIHISPLVKLENYNTVYRRSTDENAVRWVPKQEMFRFSHQVPSWQLEGDTHGLPDWCWDLDPAAMPDDLVQSVKHQHVDVTNEAITNQERKHVVAEPPYESHFADTETASQNVETQRLSEQEGARAEPYVDLNELYYPDEYATVEPKRDLELHQNQSLLSAGQATAEGHIKHDQFHNATGHVDEQNQHHAGNQHGADHS